MIFITSQIVYLKSKGYNKFTELTQFINEIIPEKYRIEKDDKFNGLDITKFDSSSDNILTAAMILKKNKFFTKFIMDLTVSPIKNDKIQKEELNLEESGLNYIKLNKKNKKSNKLYSKNMVTGTRRIIAGGLSESSASNNNLSKVNSTLSEGLLKRAEKNKLKKKSAQSFDPLVTSVTEGRKKSSSSSSSKSKSSSSSKSKSSSKSNSSSSDKRKKHDRKQKKEGAFGQLSMSSMSSSVSHKKHSKKSKHGMNKEFLSGLNPLDRQKFMKVPQNYIDEAPEHLIRGMNLNEGAMSDMGEMGMGHGMGMGQGMGMGHGMGMGMGPGMGMGMGMAPPQQMGMNDMRELSKLASYPAMPGAGGMGMGAPNPMASALGVPMMGQQMPSMMGMGGMGGMQGMPNMMGGSKKNLKKYKFVKDGFFF